MADVHPFSPPRELLAGSCALLPPAIFAGSPALREASAGWAMTGSLEVTFILAVLALPFVGAWLGIGAIEKGARLSGCLLIVTAVLLATLAVRAGLP